MARVPERRGNVAFVTPCTSRRKAQLFAAACCRRLSNFLSNYCRELLDRVDASADHPLSVAESKHLIHDAMAHADGLSYQMGTPAGTARWLVANAIWQTAEGRPIHAAREAVDAVTVSKLDPTTNMAVPGAPMVGDPDEIAAQAALVRHIVGNPFRPLAVETAWLTPTVLAVARQMYASRDFSAMPILADALQDAGCNEPDVLAHCRTGAEHMRGCWVLDLVTSRM